jgi:NADPH-dependent 2,4-dienoyl-CoA reductase/sulfur reductase-like enzyme/NAD-dependent dihydropyrimidine dehydrogenase PreA subunit
MPHLRIDQQEVEVPAGSTLLQAARKLGIDVPTLCYLEGYEASTSCQVCMVKLRGNNGAARLVPSCGTLAVDGMEVESETEEVHHLRRTALELLLSDHVGDCIAPCHFACPAHMDVPTMLREIRAGQWAEALVTIKNDIALPAILGRICPKPCEKGCRRNATDGAVAVCQLKRCAADADLASDKPYLPPCDPPTGKRVAVIGAGPTGLSAAYYLAQRGHACTVFDDQPQPGGRLLHEFKPEDLPPAVLQGEIAALLAVGVELRCGHPIHAAAFAELQQQYAAILVACGNRAKDEAVAWKLRVGAQGVSINKETYETGVPGVFAAGNAIRHKGLVVRSAADGKEAATAIHQFLSGQRVSGAGRPFSVRMGKLDADEFALLARSSGTTPLAAPPPGQSTGAPPEETALQAARCLHCDCRALDTCTLRHYAEMYGADPTRFPGTRRRLEQYVQPSGVIYEPGKCIDCGLCIQIARRAGEPLGLAFVGRGFDVRIGVPFNRTLDEAMGKVAVQCVEACPTAALSFREKGALPILGQ